MMISVRHVNKYYGPDHILKDVNFEIASGEIVGILGQNGAGKTTLMRLLTTYLEPNQGTIQIDGLNTRFESMKIRRVIGYLPENPPLYHYMNVRDYLNFAARVKDVPTPSIKAQVDRAMEECFLTDVQGQVIGTLSKGYKQRVGIAQAIVNDPKLLILDEPTSGLDPVQILQVRKLIKNLEQRRTVILSTHILSEIEQVAKRVIMIKEGRIIADQPMTYFQNYELPITARVSDGISLDDSLSKLEKVFIHLVTQPNTP